MNARYHPSSFFTAAAIMLMAIMLYDVMGIIIKHLSQHYSTQQLAMFRNIFGLLPALLILFRSQNWIQTGKPIVIRQWKLALIRSGLGVFAQISFYLSLLYLDFATAATILFARSLFITALSIPFLGHRIGLWRWLAVIIGFIGVLLIMRPTAHSVTWYTILPFCAAFCFAITSVTAKLFDDSVPTALINIYYNVGILLGTIVLVTFTGSYIPIETLGDWAWLAAMGITGGIAAYCLTSAYRLADPSSLSPLEYFGIPFSFILGWIFFSETPFDRLIPGAFLIIGSGLFIAWREHVLNKRRRAKRTFANAA